MTNDRKALRSRLLRAIYDRSGASTVAIVHVAAEWVAEVDEDALLDLARRLEYEGLITFETTGLGVSITPAGIESVERTFAPESVEAKGVAQRKLDALALLNAAYESTSGSNMKAFNPRELGTSHDWGPDRTEKAVRHLVDEGLIEHWTMGGNMRLTMEGIVFVEGE